MRQLDTLRIRRIDHLCKRLHCSQYELEKITFDPKRYYNQFDKPINGKIRHFAEPYGPLREILDSLNGILQELKLSPYFHGGVKKHSTFTNSLPHIKKPAVLGFDIENFFPSIKYDMVYQLFLKRLKCKPEVSHILTALVTLDGEIPHGSPTSVTVANLIISPMAERMYHLAKSHGSDYTQFIDDGTISGPKYLENMRPLIDKIIFQAGFKPSPKPSKRRTILADEEQIVTGIRVNQQIDVPKDKLKKAKNRIHDFALLIENGGYPSQKDITSLRGLIQYIRNLNRGAGNYLNKKLNHILKQSLINNTVIPIGRPLTHSCQFS